MKSVAYHHSSHLQEWMEWALATWEVVWEEVRTEDLRVAAALTVFTLTAAFAVKTQDFL